MNGANSVQSKFAVNVLSKLLYKTMIRTVSEDMRLQYVKSCQNFERLMMPFLYGGKNSRLDSILCSLCHAAYPPRLRHVINQTPPTWNFHYLKPICYYQSGGGTI